MRRFSSAVYCLFLFVLSSACPAQAQGLSAPTLRAIPDGTTVALQWTDAEGYRTNRIYRKSGGSDWALVAETGQASGYWDRTTVAGVTYTYRVQAITLDGRLTYSNEASATTPGPTLQPPNAPTLTAEAFSHTAIRLRIYAIETGETQYILERGESGDNWIKIASLGNLVTDYSDTGLTPATQYQYRVRGLNHAGSSPYVSALSRTLDDPKTIPPVPYIYAYPQSDTSTAIAVVWNPIPQATGYRIESKTGASDSWIEIRNITNATVTSLLHENLTPSTEYSYRIRAYNSAGLSDYSTPSTTSTYDLPLAAPQLSGFPLSYKEIELQWTGAFTNDRPYLGNFGYRLEAFLTNQWQNLAFAAVDRTNYIVRGLQPSTEYSFRIAALNPTPSEWSTVVVKTMDPPRTPPSAPVLYADRNSSTSINLKWVDVEFETEYRIEREDFPGAGIWQQIAVTPANSTSYLNTNLQPGTLYVYRIRAANLFGASPYSHESAASTRPAPEIPLFEAGAVSSNMVFLLVRPAEGASFYRVERLNALAQWDAIYETNTAYGFYIYDTGLDLSTPYTYRAGARDASGTWHYSDSFTTQTWPAEFIVIARPLSSSTVELSWPLLPYAEHIYIQRMTNGFWEWNNNVELDATSVTNYLITGLTADTTYTYRVWAGNRFGRSPEALVTVRTPGSISGAIVIRSITPLDHGAQFRLRLTGSTGQEFKVQSTSDFTSWSDRTEPLSLTADMEITVPPAGSAAFYRTTIVN